jgi:hypothetical protein
VPRGMVSAVDMGVPRRRPGLLRGLAFGVVFEVRVDDARLVPRLRERFPPGWTETRRRPAVLLSVAHEVFDTSHGGTSEVFDTSRRAGREPTEVFDTSGRTGRSPGGSVAAHGLSVRVDGRAVARGLTRAQAFDVFESELQLSVARQARPEVFVHAGVVAVGGCAILLPGRSGAGKTTLVRALVDAGAAYYSDEYAVLDRLGRVHPYARRPSVRVRTGRKQRHPVPLRRGRLPVPVGLIVETRYRRDGRWAPSQLSPGERVLVLLANTVPARDRPREVLATLSRAAIAARGVRSPRGAAGRTARALIDLARAFAGRAPPPRAPELSRRRRRSAPGPRHPGRGPPRSPPRQR